MALASSKKKAVTTYWAPATLNDAGDPTFSAPQALVGFWLEKPRIVKTGAGEEELKSEGRVALNVDVVTDGYLFKGTSAATDPTSLKGARRIITFSKQPGFKQNDFERIAYF